MSTHVREGDPGKLAYFDNPNWAPAPRVQGFPMDPRGCFGCAFKQPPDSKKWPHTFDENCDLSEKPQ